MARQVYLRIWKRRLTGIPRLCGAQSSGDQSQIQLTPRLSLTTAAEYDTGTQWEYRAGLNFTLTKNFSLITEYHSEHGFGGGFGFRF